MQPKRDDLRSMGCFAIQPLRYLAKFGIISWLCKYKDEERVHRGQQLQANHESAAHRLRDACELA